MCVLYFSMDVAPAASYKLKSYGRPRKAIQTVISAHRPATVGSLRKGAVSEIPKWTKDPNKRCQRCSLFPTERGTGFKLLEKYSSTETRPQL